MMNNKEKPWDSFVLFAPEKMMRCFSMFADSLLSLESEDGFFHKNSYGVREFVII